MKRIIFLSVALMTTSISFGQKEEIELKKEILEYIAEYKDIAIAEMNRVGIPASITLAQAIRESCYGTSYFARIGFNHFAIRCGKDWQGEVLYRYKKRFLLRDKKECFRSYDEPKQSFVDHSNLLIEAYPSFVRFGTTNYHAWAVSLERVQYGGKGYAKNLMKIITLYELQRCDEERL